MHLKEILYDWDGLNTYLFYLINKIHSPMVDAVMMTGTRLGNYKLFPVYLVLICAVMYAQSRRIQSYAPGQYSAYRSACIETLLVLCIAFACSIVWVPMLKHGFHFMRPFAALPAGTVHITDAVRNAENPNVSFPSGHSEFAMLLVASLWPMLKGYRRDIAILFFIWVAMSRLSLGVHFPADVAYSAVFSLIAVVIVRAAVRRLWTQRSAAKA